MRCLASLSLRARASLRLGRQRGPDGSARCWELIAELVRRIPDAGIAETDRATITAAGLAAVAEWEQVIGLVIEAIRKMVSRCIGGSSKDCVPIASTCVSP